MAHVIFTSLVQANNFSAAINTAIGYPKPGTRIGLHRKTGPVFITVRHGALEKHPTRNEWAYPDDAPVQSRRAQVPLPPQAESREKTPSWAPGPPGQAQARTEGNR